MGKVKITNEVSLNGQELTKKQRYYATMGKETISIKDMPDGEKISPIAYVEFEDVKDDGTESEIFAIIDADNKVYATVSNTFRTSFKNIVEVMEGDPFEIKKISGTTKAGRDYIDCELL